MGAATPCGAIGAPMGAMSCAGCAMGGGKCPLAMEGVATHRRHGSLISQRDRLDALQGTALGVTALPWTSGVAGETKGADHV